MDEQPAPTALSPIEIRLAAQAAQVPLLRAIAEMIALSADLTLDQAADVRLAAAEAAYLLIPTAVPDAVLSACFSDDGDELRVRLATITAGRPAQARAGFGWQVLRKLTDNVVAAQEPPRDRSPLSSTAVEFTRKHRPTPEPEFEG